MPQIVIEVCQFVHVVKGEVEATRSQDPRQLDYATLLGLGIERFASVPYRSKLDALLFGAVGLHYK